MRALEERIQEKGRVLDGNILKVDSFFNHQVDPELMMLMGKDFAEHFREKGITKVLTLEVSGIAMALTAALELGVPMVFAKKIKSLTLNDQVFVSQVYSYTKETTYEIRVDKRFLNDQDRVLIIDDFLASGEAAMGLAKLVESAGDTVEGIAIVIEKSFQPGRERLERAGYHVESLIRIERFEDNRCIFVED